MVNFFSIFIKWKIFVLWKINTYRRRINIFPLFSWLPFPGRTYFIKSENSNNSETTTTALHKALDAFHKSLHVCEDLKVKGNVKEVDYFEMKARLYLNIGIDLSQNKIFLNFNHCLMLLSVNIAAYSFIIFWWFFPT